MRNFARIKNVSWKVSVTEEISEWWRKLGICELYSLRTVPTSAALVCNFVAYKIHYDTNDELRSICSV